MSHEFFGQCHYCGSYIIVDRETQVVQRIRALNENGYCWCSSREVGWGRGGGYVRLIFRWSLDGLSSLSPSFCFFCSLSAFLVLETRQQQPAAAQCRGTHVRRTGSLRSSTYAGTPSRALLLLVVHSKAQIIRDKFLLLVERPKNFPFFQSTIQCSRFQSFFTLISTQSLVQLLPTNYWFDVFIFFSLFSFFARCDLFKRTNMHDELEFALLTVQYEK